jgi:hypothetical protein
MNSVLSMIRRKYFLNTSMKFWDITYTNNVNNGIKNIHIYTYINLQIYVYQYMYIYFYTLILIVIKQWKYFFPIIKLRDTKIINHTRKSLKHKEIKNGEKH